VVFVLDRSGSMQGTPLEQAKKAVEACLGATSEKDRMGFVAFDDTAELFESALVACTPANRDKLRQHLAGVQARGGTELAAGIQAAVKLAGTGSADLFVITDGQVSASEDILSASRAAGARLHCLGIGAASQDRFLTLLARETGGVSRFVTPRERVDTAALELFASAGRPLASGVEVSFQALPGGRAVLPPATEVFEGHPLVVMGEADAGPGGALEITWAAGREKARLQVAMALDNPHDGETARLLQGARLITDWESRLSGEPAGRPANRWQARNEARILAKLEQLSRDYGLASRAMALVAVVERAGDDASELPTTRMVPVGMPEDTCFESYFPAFQKAPIRLACRMAEGISDRLPPKRPLKRVAAEVGSWVKGELREPVRFYAVKETTDLLLEAAGRLLPDGGLPGASEEDRLLRSTALLLAFLGAGSTALDGPFRLHVQKLLGYLDGAAAGVPRRTAQHLIRELVYYARERRAFRHQPEDWIAELVAWSLPPGAAVWTYLEERFLELV
jgi:hypothetical protein